jgi:hypothetical protein
MVDKLIIIVAVIVLVAIAFIVLQGRGKDNNVPDINDALKQISLPVFTSTSTQGNIGFTENKATSLSTPDEIKNNIASGNLVTENAIRQLNDDVKDVVQINTLTDGGVQTRETGGILLAKTPTSELIVTQAFAPQGDDPNLAGVRGTTLPTGAISRTEESFEGILTTEAGGTRKISGSKELFERLQNNLLNA